MRSQLSWNALWVLSAVFGVRGSALLGSPIFQDPAPLKYEHPGDLFKSVSGTSCCVSGVLTNGNSTGHFRNISGINTYLSYPPNNKTDAAILYLTDIFGVPLVNNRLLGDSFAKAGYFVVMPDMFNGDAIPIDGLTDPNFNMTAWRERHSTEVVDKIVNSTINSILTEFGVKTIGAAGYCFGGKFLVRFLASGNGLDAGFTAHPAGVEAAEWQAISAPLSIAFGELDGSNPPAQRSAAEAIFQGKNATYQTSLYSGAEHGFAVRTDLSDPRKRFAQESAYFQAVRWFDAWLKA